MPDGRRILVEFKPLESGGFILSYSDITDTWQRRRKPCSPPGEGLSGHLRKRARRASTAAPWRAASSKPIPALAELLGYDSARGADRRASRDIATDFYLDPGHARLPGAGPGRTKSRVAGMESQVQAQGRRRDLGLRELPARCATRPARCSISRASCATSPPASAPRRPSEKSQQQLIDALESHLRGLFLVRPGRPPGALQQPIQGALPQRLGHHRAGHALHRDYPPRRRTGRHQGGRGPGRCRGSRQRMVRCIATRKGPHVQAQSDGRWIQINEHKTQRRRHGRGLYRHHRDQDAGSRSSTGPTKTMDGLLQELQSVLDTMDYGVLMLGPDLQDAGHQPGIPRSSGA